MNKFLIASGVLVLVLVMAHVRNPFHVTLQHVRETDAEYGSRMAWVSPTGAETRSFVVFLDGTGEFDNSVGPALRLIAELGYEGISIDIGAGTPAEAVRNVQTLGEVLARIVPYRGVPDVVIIWYQPAEPATVESRVTGPMRMRVRRIVCIGKTPGAIQQPKTEFATKLPLPENPSAIDLVILTDSLRGQVGALTERSDETIKYIPIPRVSNPGDKLAVLRAVVDAFAVEGTALIRSRNNTPVLNAILTGQGLTGLIWAMFPGIVIVCGLGGRPLESRHGGMEWTVVFVILVPIVMGFAFLSSTRGNFERSMKTERYEAHVAQLVARLIDEYDCESMEHEIGIYTRLALQHRSYAANVDDEMFYSYVLSPDVQKAGSVDFGWRPVLWNGCIERVRGRSSVQLAAGQLALFLRERLSIAAQVPPGRSIAENWRTGVTSAEDFQIIHLAALRSVGIPARYGSDGKPEMWTGNEWTAAPQPPVLQIDLRLDSPTGGQSGI